MYFTTSAVMACGCIVRLASVFEYEGDRTRWNVQHERLCKEHDVKARKCADCGDLFQFKGRNHRYCAECGGREGAVRRYRANKLLPDVQRIRKALRRVE